MEDYRSASVIFWKYGPGREVLIFLGYEEAVGSWRHFGGRREEYDTRPYQTMTRELREETEYDLQLGDMDTSHYFQSSKQVVYLHKCPRRFTRHLNGMKPSPVKSQYKWFKMDELEIVPRYIQEQIRWFHLNKLNIN